jgi:hypothetical protein
VGGGGRWVKRARVGSRRGGCRVVRWPEVRSAAAEPLPSRVLRCQSGRRTDRRSSASTSNASSMGRLVDVDEAEPSPADAREPRPGRCDGRRSSRTRRRGTPSVGPRGRRARIQPSHRTKMLASVVQDVDERVPDLAGRPERASMVAIAPDASMSAQGAIDRLCQADRKALDAAGESCGVVRFDEQVHVVVLHAVVQKPQIAHDRECLADCAEDAPVAQGRQVGRRAEGDVRGAATIVGFSTTMRDGASPRRRGASGSSTTTTPAMHRKVELSDAPSHLNWAYIIKLARRSTWLHRAVMGSVEYGSRCELRGIIETGDP